MRIADGWEETRERLRLEVLRRGASAVAADIPVARRTIFRLLGGETQAPSLSTQECIERMLDDRDVAEMDG